MLEPTPQTPSPFVRLRHWIGGLPIQNKAWFAIILLTIAGCLVVSMGVYQTFSRSFDQMEKRSLAADVARLERLLQHQVDQLENVARDYAFWDETVDYIKHRTPRYEEANFNLATLGTLQLKAFLLFDSKGSCIAGHLIDEKGNLASASPEDWTRVFKHQVGLALQEDANGNKGFIRIPGGSVAYYSCMPVRRNEGKGPTSGALIHVRKLNPILLRELTHIDLSLDDMDYSSSNSLEQQLNNGSTQLPYTSVIQNSDWIVFHVPIRDSDGRQIAHFHGRMERTLQQGGRRAQMILFTGIFSITILAGLAMVWLLRMLVIARLEKLNAEVRRIGEAGTPDARVTLTGHDEISELGNEINKMLEAMVYVQARHAEAIETSEKLEAQLLQAQKMEAIGTMAGGLAHDFNNMLSSILGSADLLRYDLPQNHAGQEHIRRIEKAGASASALVQQLLAVSRRQTLKPEPIRLSETVMDALRLLQAALPKNIEFQMQPESANDTVMADSAQIHQVVMNLATNAAHAMAGRDRGLFSVTIQDCRLPAPDRPETRTMPQGEYLRMIISDNGSGIPAENMERIFEPFFTTKPSGSGTGLGLAVVHGIIGKHNGCIGVQSRQGEGTSFFIHLPRAADTAISASEQSTRQSLASRRQDNKSLHILLVDDDRMVCETLSNGLRRQGFVVHAATHTEEALRLLADPGIPISVMITDQMMPGLNGMELGARARTLRPGLPMILISGYAASLEEDHVHTRGFSLMMTKPLTAGQISQAIMSALKIDGGR